MIGERIMFLWEDRVAKNREWSRKQFDMVVVVVLYSLDWSTS
jgi:hypothetical protein